MDHSIYFDDVFLECGPFLDVLFISSVCGITMIRSFSSSMESDIGLEVFKTGVGSFTSLTRTIMSLVL